jgi:hypothetical protein
MQLQDINQSYHIEIDGRMIPIQVYAHTVVVSHPSLRFAGMNDRRMALGSACVEKQRGR